MKPLPQDPMRRHDQWIAAICEDSLELGTFTITGQRSMRLREISRQTTRETDDAKR